MSLELVISQIVENAFNIDFQTIFAVIFRTTIVTLLIVFVIKWLGNKGLGQLSTIELIIILGLGNAVSELMLNPTGTSIPQGFAVIIIAIAMFKLYDYLTTKYKRFGKMIIAEPVLLFKDGNILQDALLKVRISKDEFNSYLRLSGTENVTDIKLSYLEMQREPPEWIEYKIDSEIQFQENKEELDLLLRSFLMNKINETFIRYRKSIDPSTSIDVINQPFDYRLNFCLKNNLIPFINANAKGEIIITSDLIQELKNHRISAISSLQEVSNIIDGFEYGQKKFAGRNLRAAVGSRIQFSDFLIFEEEKQCKSDSKTQSLFPDDDFNT